MLRFFVLLVFAATGYLGASQPLAYFSEDIDISKKFIEEIEKEKVCIRMASYRLSDAKVVKALVEAHQKGVSVEVIVDSVTVTKKTPVKILVDSGVPVYVWKVKGGKKGKSQHMHHSFCLFGKDVAWSGSYSFSLEKVYQHREGVLVLHDEKIVSSFLGEFEQIKKKHALSYEAYLAQKKGAR